MTRFLPLIALCVACAIHFLPMHAVEAQQWRDYDPTITTVVGGNLSSQGGNLQGRTVVRGNFTGQSPGVGTALNPPASFQGINSLIVGGNLGISNLNVNAGDVRIGGTSSGNINYNPENTVVYLNDETALATASNAVNELHAASEYFAGLAANSSVIQSGNNYTFTATPGPDGIAVFNVTSALLTAQNANFLLAVAGVPADTTFIMNVIDSVGNIQGNFGSNFRNSEYYSRILWNFEGQTDMLTVGRDWYGSILMPDASLTNTSAVHGAVLVGGDFNQRADVRYPGYQGAIPAAVPEPASTTLLAVVGLGFVAYRYRKRGRREV